MRRDGYCDFVFPIPRSTWQPFIAPTRCAFRRTDTLRATQLLRKLRRTSASSPIHVVLPRVRTVEIRRTSHIPAAHLARAPKPDRILENMLMWLITSRRGFNLRYHSRLKLQVSTGEDSRETKAWPLHHGCSKASNTAIAIATMAVLANSTDDRLRPTEAVAMPPSLRLKRDGMVT